MAYDLTGKQRVVVRGASARISIGRVRRNAHALTGNRAELVTVRYSQLQNLGTGAD